MRSVHSNRLLDLLFITWKSCSAFEFWRKFGESRNFMSNAGRRTDSRDKKSRDFPGEIFLERNYCSRTGFSGSNPWKNLSHPVMSWYGSRAVGCPIAREITARTVFSSWKRFKRRNTPRFRRFFLEKRPWKRFSTNVLIRGKWIHSTAN